MLGPAAPLPDLGQYTEPRARIPYDDKEMVALLRQEINKEVFMISIGVDIARNTFETAEVSDGSKNRLGEYEYDKTGIKKFINDLQSKGERVQVAMEATGRYHLRLAEALHTAEIPVAVVNPLIIKRYGEMKLRRLKTDKADAMLIAEYAFHEKPALFKPLTSNRRKIMEFLGGIEDLILMKTQIAGRLEALGIMPEPCEEVMGCFQENLEQINKAIKVLEKQLLKLILAAHEETYRLVISVPGIGDRIAALIIGLFGDFEDFAEAGKAACFIGLTPFEKQSGTSVKWKGSISKKGNAYARKLFYLGALSAAIWNPQCRALYERLIAAGRLTRVAHVAVGHKLLRQAFGVVKNKKVFDASYVSRRKIA
jgi:transposase